MGKTKLYFPKHAPASMASLNTRLTEYLEVTMSTLESIHLVKCIDLIKINIEGFKSKIFLGGQNSLDKFKSIILEEVHTQNELIN